MADYDNTNSGIIFLEQDKESEKHPDYTGKLDVKGKEYRLAGWKRIGKSGKPFISLKLSEPEQKKDWVKPEVREKFKKDEIVEVTEEPINLDDIPF